MSRRTKSFARRHKNPSAKKSMVKKRESKKCENTIPTKDKAGSDAVSQVEDGVMKVMMEFFSEEMLPVFGITMKATKVLARRKSRLSLAKDTRTSTSKWKTAASRILNSSLQMKAPKACGASGYTKAASATK